MSPVRSGIVGICFRSLPTSRAAQIRWPRSISSRSCAGLGYRGRCSNQSVATHRVAADTSTPTSVSSLVEVDGGLHLLTLNYWADAQRQNDLVIGGDRILRFPSIAFRVDMPAVEAQLRRAGVAFGLIAA